MVTIRYMTSLLTFYLKGEISADQNFVKFKTPNTILGVIPLGAKKENVPVTQISSTEANFKLKFFRLILGVLIAVGGVVLLPKSLIGGILIIVLGANSVINSFEINLDVNMTSGKQRHIDFFILEKSKADQAEREINAIVGNRLDDTNNRVQTDRLVDVISSLKKD